MIPASGRLARARPHRQLLLGASLLGVCGSLLTLAPGLPTILVGLALSATGVFLAQSTVNAFTASNAGTDKPAPSASTWPATTPAAARRGAAGAILGPLGWRAAWA